MSWFPLDGWSPPVGVGVGVGVGRGVPVPVPLVGSDPPVPDTIGVVVVLVVVRTVVETEVEVEVVVETDDEVDEVVETVVLVEVVVAPGTEMVIPASRQMPAPAATAWAAVAGSVQVRWMHCAITAWCSASRQLQGMSARHRGLMFPITQVVPQGGRAPS